MLMKIAAIRYGKDEGSTVDQLLVRLAARLKRDGLRVGGAVQHNENNGDRRCDAMELEDPATGGRIRICDSIPETMPACRVDEDALREAVAWSEAALNGGVDILIVNKYGKREAQGRGFHPVIQLAAELGIPVIVGVSHRNITDWELFTDDHAEYLPANYTVILDWCLKNAVPQQCSRHLDQAAQS
jgi:nucleoside-triphosphatase THEP1